MGVKSIWFDVKNYLQTNQISHVTILGKSLGGAHAQYLTVLIAGKTQTAVKSLVTFASVGVPESVHTLFNALGAKPPILILRNSGNDGEGEVDDIPRLGGSHLCSSTTECLYLSPKTLVYPYQPERKNYFEKIKKLLGSFNHAHARQTTLSKSYNIHPGIIGEHYEKLRAPAVHLVHYATMGLLNRSTFSSFYAA